jgi:hypothetical protein
MLDRMARQIALGVLDLQDVQEVRGFLKGMDAVLSAPRNTLRELDRMGDKDS